MYIGITTSRSCASSINWLLIFKIQLKKGAEVFKATFLLYTTRLLPGFVTVILPVTTIGYRFL